MSLLEYYNFIKEETKWKSESRIIGKAGEKYCIDNLRCQYCFQDNWYECPTNTKAKDQICNKCNKKYQIKCKKISIRKYNDIKKKHNLKILGAEYKTTLKSINEKIDYIIVLYDENLDIIDIMHVKSSCFDKNNIIPRNPLKPTARRAGWQGCYLNFNNFVLFGHLNIKRVSLESNDP